MEFSYNGNTILLNYDNNELYDLFLIRGNFIIKNIDNIKYFDDLIKLSHIYIYNKYYGCTYNKSILDRLNNLIG